MVDCYFGRHQHFWDRGWFKSADPYRFTRNPLYLGEMALFLGLSVIGNSLLYLWIAHALLILVFVVTPLAEEIWLEERRDPPISLIIGISPIQALIAPYS